MTTYQSIAELWTKSRPGVAYETPLGRLLGVRITREERGFLNSPYVSVNPLISSVGARSSRFPSTRMKLENPKSASFKRPRMLRMLSGLMSACQLVSVSDRNRGMIAKLTR